MRFAFFVHSLASDWNHGNAHFLRGVVRQLRRMGHETRVLELRDNWSRWNLERDHGPDASEAYHEAYPELTSETFEMASLDLDALIADADVVVVHEFNQPELVAAIGEHRRTHPGYSLLFHDTHHRGVTAPHAIGRYDLRHFDGVLAFGDVLRDLYLRNRWTSRAWTWHEAADHTVFHPPETREAPVYDLVWIGNWGDDERTAELHEFLLGPVRELGLRAKVWGVRYPEPAVAALSDAGIAYGGYLPNHRAPRVFAQARVTVHVPRRPYTQALPGIPTIRPFEALSCGIPLISSPWSDSEGLFDVGQDFLMVRSGREMAAALNEILRDPDLAHALAAHGRRTVLNRHTCEHRAAELVSICDRLRAERREAPRLLLPTA